MNNLFPSSIQKLISQFSKFPTIGPRTAARFVFFLLYSPKEEVKDLIEAILNFRKSIKICSFCFNPFESSNAGETGFCKYCSNPARDRSMLCVVEKETDLYSLEQTGKYKGLYFILGGTVASLKQEDIQKLRIKELLERIKNPTIPGASFKEIIIATNPTTEGIATSLYLKRALKEFDIKITKLGLGLPIGGELEYADQETLSSALEERK